jgi:hypothetical protein
LGSPALDAVWGLVPKGARTAMKKKGEAKEVCLWGLQKIIICPITTSVQGRCHEHIRYSRRQKSTDFINATQGVPSTNC